MIYTWLIYLLYIENLDIDLIIFFLKLYLIIEHDAETLENKKVLKSLFRIY